MGATGETEREGKLDSQGSKTFAEEHRETVTKASTCSYHLGYLSERSKKESIPEECIMCDNIVKCMLKGMTG